jgi:hypothetical protein
MNPAIGALLHPATKHTTAIAATRFMPRGIGPMARERNANRNYFPLTETQWFAFNDPDDLLHHIRATASHRKLRLFACECCRPLVGKVKGASGASKMAAAERFADGLIDREKFLAAFARRRSPPHRANKLFDAIWFAFDALGWPPAEQTDPQLNQEPHALAQESWAVREYAEHHTYCAYTHAVFARTLLALSDAGGAHNLPSNAFHVQSDGATAEYADLFREVFANPFRPVAFHPDWRTDTVMSLATAAYESRDFSTLPILADALQDAGSDADDLLAHCRDPKQAHVRGCWAVDLVLGKA